MANPYIGEIRMFGGNFAPLGWSFCWGQQVAISQFDALYTLIGTTYGGDGVNTFNLPNLASRIPISMGQGPGLSNYVIGQFSGSEQVTVLTSQLPQHTHSVLATSVAGDQPDPLNHLWASAGTGAKLYSAATPSVPMNPTRVSLTGGGLPHENRMPFLAVSFIISMFGIYPTPA